MNNEASSTKPCLCIVFNHPFPQNIAVLEKIYRPRFSNLKFLVPFYRDESNPDVIPVYRGSYTHQGFATDAYASLKDIDCSHYIFLQDDVLLNPTLNEDTLLPTLGVGKNDGFINQISNLVMDIGGWHWILGILWKFFYPRNQLSGSGVDSTETMLRYLPPVEKAMERLGRYGVVKPVITRHAASLAEESVVLDIPYFGTGDRELVRGMNRLVVESLFATTPEKDRIELPYPLALSAWGADFFAVPKKDFANYQHYAGILAAASTFAEVSVATALALAVDSIVVTEGSGFKFEWVWTPDREHQSEDLAAKLQDPTMIAVHPVKLSILMRDRAAFARMFPGIEVED